LQQKKVSETEGKVVMPQHHLIQGSKGKEHTYYILLLDSTKGQKIGKAYKRSTINLFKAYKKAQRTRKPHLTKGRK
jgi:hypothetical protein